MSTVYKFFAAALLLFSVAVKAHATPMPVFFTSADGNGYFEVQGTGNADGTFTATSGTLTMTSGLTAGSYDLVVLTNPGILSLPNTSPSTWFPYDNKINPKSFPILTVYGLLFANANFEINIWGYYDSNTGNYYGFSAVDYNDPNYKKNCPVVNAQCDANGLTYASSNIYSFVVPEPSSLALFSLGLIGFTGLTKRRKAF